MYRGGIGTRANKDRRRSRDEKYYRGGDKRDQRDKSSHHEDERVCEESQSKAKTNMPGMLEK